MQWSALIVPLVACVASVVLTGVANTSLRAPAAEAQTTTPAPAEAESTDVSAPTPSSEGLEATEVATAQPSEIPRSERASPAGLKSAPSASESAALYADAGRARRVGALPKAIALYELLQTRYPGTAEARAADMALALLHARQGTHAVALEYFDRYLRHSPHGDLAAEAMWGKSQTLTRLQRVEDTYRTLHRLQLLHPNSAYAIEARARLQSEDDPLRRRPPDHVE